MEKRGRDGSWESSSGVKSELKPWPKLTAASTIACSLQRFPLLIPISCCSVDFVVQASGFITPAQAATPSCPTVITRRLRRTEFLILRPSMVVLVAQDSEVTARETSHPLLTMESRLVLARARRCQHQCQ